MAQIKYAPGETPLRKEHSGYTFIRNTYGRSVMRGQSNQRNRYPSQFEKMQVIIRLTRMWKNLDVSVQTAWETFAATFPQSTKRGVPAYLTGYQLFLKRNSYCLYNFGTDSEIMSAPVMSVVAADTVTIAVTNDPAATLVLDVTDLYIARFGILPEQNDRLLFHMQIMGAYNGQFYSPISGQINVDAVYVDGLFVSFYFPVDFVDITVSLFLSRPVSPGKLFHISKTRYMGCAQNGTSFDCDSLLACDVIQQIIDQIEAIGAIVSESQNTSIPPVKYGVLYNKFFSDTSNWINGNGWRVPIYATDLFPLLTTAPYNFELAKKLKENNASYWQAGFVADNAYLSNFRGSGYRASTGLFSSLLSYFWGWLQRDGLNIRYFRFDYNDLSVSGGSSSFAGTYYGMPIRLVRDAVGIADGTLGVYTGNNLRVYRTFVLNEKEWLADNLAETLLNDLTPIQIISDNSAWIAATGQAACYYNNDLANV